VSDLRGVLAAVDLDPQYADVCPRCRRRLLGFTQGVLMGRAGGSPWPA
jgi:hypothetical protein